MLYSFFMEKKEKKRVEWHVNARFYDVSSLSCKGRITCRAGHGVTWDADLVFYLVPTGGTVACSSRSHSYSTTSTLASSFAVTHFFSPRNCLSYIP
jgi:hypothetical protein